MIILQTQRLLVRDIRDTDFDDIFRIQSDPDIMRYIRAPVSDPAIVRERIEFWSKYHADNPNYGVFIIESLETGGFAGYCVARHANFDVSRDLEIGYIIIPGLEGRGLATEVSKGLMEYLIRVAPGLKKIVAFTDPANAASQRVLGKCGFERMGMMPNNDGDSVVFEYLVTT